jgi:hypothetical protein
MTFPFLSTATHSDTDGHETPDKSVVPIGVGVDHAVLPPVGFVDLSTSSELSTATHSEADGHETALRVEVSILTGADQAAAPPVG